jgi:hypothetical protein
MKSSMALFFRPTDLKRRRILLIIFPLVSPLQIKSEIRLPKVLHEAADYGAEVVNSGA